MGVTGRANHFLFLIALIFYLVAACAGFDGADESESPWPGAALQIVASESIATSTADEQEASVSGDSPASCHSMLRLDQVPPHLFLLPISILKERQLILRC